MKKNANFSILGPKSATKKPLEIFFLDLDKFMDNNEVSFSRSTFLEKPRKSQQGSSFS